MSQTHGPFVTIVGAGLAGCEAAYQLATRGHRVRLIEQKPAHRTPAQSMDGFAELVCSNSLRGSALTNAVGLMKEELRRVGSLVMACAEETRVPAGGALAVDREMFSRRVTQEIGSLPLIEVCSELVERIPDASPSHPVVLATGPLTGDALASDLARVIGQDHLAYYDAIAPIVTYESLDLTRVFRQSRWGRSESSDGARDAEALGDEAYLNCPMTEDEYVAFVSALLAAEKVPPRAFEKANYFEGCLPIEVMAERGLQTLSFGPMKPIGLTDPRTGRRPYAVVQLRQEDEAATAYNLVGFQTRMTHPSQARVFRMIPGLEQAEFQRYGSVHRNTFVDAPRVLDGELSLRGAPNVYLAGQITGVEGYVESAACGFLCAVTLAQRLAGGPLVPPPPTTTLGAILTHLGRGEGRFQPSNVTFAWLPPHPNRRLRKRDRYQALAERALSDLGEWCASLGIGPRSHVSATDIPS